MVPGMNPLTPLTLIVCVLLCACASPVATKTNDPYRDEVFVLGDEIVPPMGCLMWQGRDPDAEC